MKKLVISWDTYTWVHNLAGLIARAPKEYEVLIVTKDDQSPIHWLTKQLCRKAVYAQRMDDIFWIGSTMGIPRMSNMLVDPLEVDEDKLIAELQMKLAFGGFDEVYIQDNVLLERIFKAIKKKINVKVAIFDKLEGESETYTLSEEERKRKCQLLELMVALPFYVIDYDNEERLYRI